MSDKCFQSIEPSTINSKVHRICRLDSVHFPSRSGEERSGRRASRIRGAGKKLEILKEVVMGEQERERALWPAIVSLRRTAASEIQNLNEGQGQSPAVGNNGVTH